MVRAEGVEPSFHAWEAHVIAVILRPQGTGFPSPQNPGALTSPLCNAGTLSLNSNVCVRQVSATDGTDGRALKIWKRNSDARAISICACPSAPSAPKNPALRLDSNRGQRPISALGVNAPPLRIIPAAL